MFPRKGKEMKTESVVSWEAHLIRQAAAGERVAFELIADQYRTSLYSLAIRMLRNSDDANDVVQETFVKAFRAIKDFDATRPIKPWLCRICANCCVDAVRHRKREGDSIDNYEYMLVDPADTPEGQAADTLDGELVRRAVDRLPEKYRRIIVMRHFEHLDVNEIADRLEKPEGTIKSWLFRARALLKKDLEPLMS